MKTILPPNMLNHWLLFVIGISILLSDSISEQDLLIAHFCLRRFYEDFASHYGQLVYFSLLEKKKNPIPIPNPKIQFQFQIQKSKPFQVKDT